MSKTREVFCEIAPGFKIRTRFPGPAFIGCDPKSFYHKVVKGNLREFYENPNDIRKGLNASITLYHMLDWHCKTPEEKKSLFEKVPYGDILENIANGAKHSNPDKPYKTYVNADNKLMVFKNEQEFELLGIIKSIEEFWDKIYDTYYIGIYNENTQLFE